MKIEDVKTSADAATETLARRSQLEELQTETEDATWLASQDIRNHLEHEIRTLEQLRTRMAEREQREETAALETELGGHKATIAAADPNVEKVKSLIRDCVGAVLPLLRGHRTVFAKKQAAKTRAASLLARLGRTDNQHKATRDDIPYEPLEIAHDDIGNAVRGTSCAALYERAPADADTFEKDLAAIFNLALGYSLGAGVVTAHLAERRRWEEPTPVVASVQEYALDAEAAQ